MALLYDSFGVRGMVLRVNMFPPIRDRFPEGVLPVLYASLNQDGTFDNCYGRGQHAATFEGEDLVYEIDTASIEITVHAFQEISLLRKRIGHLLEQTRDVISGQRRRLFLVDEISISGLVPDEKERHMGSVIRKKLLTRFKDEHYQHLAGDVEGAALQFAGETPDFDYKVTIAPYLRTPDNLFLEAELDFPYPDPEELGEKEIQFIETDVQAAYDFLTGNVVPFARSFLV